MKIEINDKSLFSKNEEDYLCTEVDGEMVIMNAQSGQYFGLNSVSTDIWKAIADKTSFSQIIDALIKEYNVEREKCISETSLLLAKMCQLKMLNLEN